MARPVSPLGRWLQVYTDGAVSRNGGKNPTGGVGVWFGPKHPLNVSERFLLEPVTNNRAEIFAIVCALGIIIDQFTRSTVSRITVYTDSIYAYNIATQWIAKWKANGWRTSSGKPVKNRDMIAVLEAQLLSVRQEWPGPALAFKHVYGHSGNVGNEGADALACAGKTL